MMNFRSYNDSPEIQRKDYSKRIVFSPEDFKDKKHLLLIVTIPPQTKQRLHVHKLQTEVYLVLDGQGLIFINDKEMPANSGDAFITTPGDEHKFWNETDKEFRLAVFKTDVDESIEDTIWLE